MARNIQFDTNGEPKRTKRNIAKVIRDAADWLEQNPDKHISGYHSKDGCHCALGAIDKVCGVTEYPDSWKTHYNNYWVTGTRSFAIGSVRVCGESLYFINDDCVNRGDKPAVIKTMRQHARDLEHGGKL